MGLDGLAGLLAGDRAGLHAGLEEPDLRLEGLEAAHVEREGFGGIDIGDLADTSFAV